MDTKNMRAQFEERYPVPEGVAWNPDSQRYVLTHLKICTVSQYEQHVERWVCWRASREAVVVQMPNRASEAYHEEFDDVEGGSFNEAAYIRDVRKAIEAQGLKVAP
ncbi:hypothetical protein [Pseudomonas asiatica]|uniref:Uncharacterized protein n=1 Tax=Pseudomonas asiatica TaxID=2219225 RepID=A0A9X4HWW1_9PSED|nr:hypothetical protein [Pseudomonas asiatica]MDD2108983.1 hypothetical protein [Pseudomonas asiatica]